MSDSYKGLIVTFEKPVPEDAIQYYADLFKLISGVVGVEPVVDDMDDRMNRSSVRHELLTEIGKLIREKKW